MSSTGDSTAGRTQDGAGSFKTHSAHYSVDDIEQSRQPSYLAAVVGNSETSQGKRGKCVHEAGHCRTGDTGQESPYGVSRKDQMTDKNNFQRNKHAGSSVNHTQTIAAACDTLPVSSAVTKPQSQRFSDLEQWLKNGDDDTTSNNYIDRRMVENVLKCRQLGKPFPEKKPASQLAYHGLNRHVANIGGVDGLKNGSHEAGQHGRCGPMVTEDLYREFGGKLDSEVDGDSGFSGDRNSSSSTSSGLSVESSLTSLGSIADCWSGDRSSSDSVPGVLSMDRSVTEPAAPVLHVPGSLPSRTSAGGSDISSSGIAQVAPNVHSNQLASEPLYGPLPRRKTVEPHFRPCDPSNVSSCHHQLGPLSSATSCGWCSSYEYL